MAQSSAPAHSTKTEAADASGSGETEAPSGPSIVNGEKNMDTASSTLPTDTQQATSSPPAPELDPAPEAEPLDVILLVDAPPQGAPEPGVEPANDNTPPPSAEAI